MCSCESKKILGTLDPQKAQLDHTVNHHMEFEVPKLNSFRVLLRKRKCDMRTDGRTDGRTRGALYTPDYVVAGV